MKILHIAPENFAGVPFTIVEAERELGYQSRLITFFRKSNYEEDISLDLPFIKNPVIDKLRDFKYSETLSNRLRIPEKIPIHYTEKGILSFIRDKIWESRIKRFLQNADFDLYDFDIYQLDGGLGFLRNCKFIRKLVEKNKKIICFYYGSDLRIRGVIPYIDKISSLNLTVEYYHKYFHPNINFVPFPFDSEKFKNFTVNLDKVVIGHSPTNRLLKGTDVILQVLSKLRGKYDFEIKMIENLPYDEAIRAKSECTIFIDQISDFGYGISGLESLAMGIPTCTSLVKDFPEEYPEHPFIEVNESDLYEKLEKLILDKNYRSRKGSEGKNWVRDVHNHLKVVNKIHQYIRDISNN